MCRKRTEFNGRYTISALLKTSVNRTRSGRPHNVVLERKIAEYVAESKVVGCTGFCWLHRILNLFSSKAERSAKEPFIKYKLETLQLSP